MKKLTNQHGDVLLFNVSSIPNKAKKLKIENGFIIERGEGVHTHIIPDVSNVEIFESDEEMYIRVLKETKIDHEEHGLQILDPGIYKKEIERQFDYENEIERKVID